jgi:hypothetical protein
VSSTSVHGHRDGKEGLLYLVRFGFLDIEPSILLADMPEQRISVNRVKLASL